MTDPSNRELDASIVICTRDRADMLRAALQSLVECDKPERFTWEVLVVNNGSRDATPAVAERFCGTLPLRLVEEPTAGLSNARNRALEEVRGRWVIWLDDDATVHRSWLAAYAEAFLLHPQSAVFGGAITVNLTGQPPDWLLEGMEFVGNAFAGREAQSAFEPINPLGPLPYGANFAIRRAAVCGRRFDPNLGRHPTRPTLGFEETRMIRALLNGHGQGRWVPAAGVTHHIDALRQTPAYLRSYYSDMGLMKAFEGKRRNLFRKVISSSKRICLNEAWYLSLCLLGKTRHRTLALRNAGLGRGYIRGYLRMAGLRLARRPIDFEPV